MTAHTVACDVDVIEVRRYPAHGAVTIVAGVATGNVCQVFANGDDAIMAGAASPNDLAVIDHHYRRKDISRVTVFANIGCLDVRRIFSGGVRAVMAANTIASNVDVVEIRR